MSKRTTWDFTYTVKEILDAALDKKAHHLTRLEWWKNKQVEVEDLIRKDGIDFDESIVSKLAKTGYNTSNARGVSVNIKEEYVADLNECTQKIAEHRAQVKGFDGWIQVLTSQKASDTLVIQHDDWLYFFGKM